MPDVLFRWAIPRDARELGAVMFDAVRHGPSGYSEVQRRAWTPHPRRGPEWEARLQGQIIRIAEIEGRAIGFMSFSPPDYVDFAYIRPGARRLGVFRRLHEAIEARARELGAQHLSTHASLMARPAFEAVGFSVVRSETVALTGQAFARFEMKKPLKNASA